MNSVNIINFCWTQLCKSDKVVSQSQFNYILDIDSCIISAWKYIGDGAVTDIGEREEQ